MQSIWYGQTGNIFDPVQAEELLDYTAEAFQFAHTINCPSLVFGCPKNRRLDPPHTAAEGDAFFAKAGALASHYDVVLAIEANPPVYTNYLNNTADAFAMVKRLQSPGLAVNLDLSTMISNGERCGILWMISNTSAMFISASRGWNPLFRARNTKNLPCC